MTITTFVAGDATRKNSDLEKLKRDIAGRDPNNDDDFREILITARDAFAMTDGDLASAFFVSRPTVSRWISGRNLPHRALRRPVFDWIAKEASRQLGARRPERTTSRHVAVSRRG